MANPLLAFWHQIFGQSRPPSLVSDPFGPSGGVGARGHGSGLVGWRRLTPMTSAAQASATIFLFLRRMRAPFVVLIAIFGISTLGLLLIPGQDADGRPEPMTVLDAFYVIAYTATTIGFGEIPAAFTPAQRMWVIGAIFFSVLGWAYAVGTLFALIQDRDFRQALSLQRFIRTVRRLREPFLLVAGHGQTGERLGLSLDALGRRFVVLDRDESQVAALDQEPYHFDVPGLVADARNPAHLLSAGLAHPSCEGVLAITDNEEANLAVVMSAALLRPDLPVIARASSPVIVQRMQTFGDPVIVNPFDAFGDHLRTALHAPAAYQLEQWLTALPGEAKPERRPPVPRGRWVVCGYGRFGQAVTKDLRAEGLDVTIVDAGTTTSDDPTVVIAPGIELDWMARADVDTAVGLVTATNNDISNLSLIAAARQANPGLFIVGRQNQRANEPLFAASTTDLVLVPPDVVAHEVLTRLGSPELVRFLHELPRRRDKWASDVVARLEYRCRPTALITWHVRLTVAGGARALFPWLATGEAHLGDLLRSPVDRNEPLEAVALMVVRDGVDIITPSEDFVLESGDLIFLAGHARAQQELELTFVDAATRAYVLENREVPSGWIWRKLSPAHR